MCLEVRNVPHVPHTERVTVDDLGYLDDGIVGVRVKLGFNDSMDIPHNLRWSRGKSEGFRFDATSARYFLSVLNIRAERKGGRLNLLRRRLFVLLSRNAGSRVEAFRLPPDRTAILGGTLYI